MMVLKNLEVRTLIPAMFSIAILNTIVQAGIIYVDTDAGGAILMLIAKGACDENVTADPYQFGLRNRTGDRKPCRNLHCHQHRRRC